MENDKKDQAVIAVLLKRFEEQRLPRLLEIKKNVDQGLTLSTHEIAFLEEVFNDARKNEAYRNKDAAVELRELISKAISLYHEITEKAVENEQKNN